MIFSQVFFTLLSAAPALSAPVFGDSVAAVQQPTYEFTTRFPEYVKSDLVARDSASDEIQSILSTFGSQIDNMNNLLSGVLASPFGTLSQQLGSDILSPFIQTLTNDIEQSITKISSGTSSINSQIIGTFLDGINELTALTKEFNIDTTSLQSIISKIEGLFPNISKRYIGGNGLIGVFGSMNNARQIQGALNGQLSRSRSNATTEINNFITAFENEVKTVIDSVNTILDSFFGNFGKQISNLLASPFLQMAIDGAEQLINRLTHIQPAGLNKNALTNLNSAFDELTGLCQHSGLNANGLIQANQQLQSFLSKLG